MVCLPPPNHVNNNFIDKNTMMKFDNFGIITSSRIYIVIIYVYIMGWESNAKQVALDQSLNVNENLYFNASINHSDINESTMPRFAEIIPNVTVTIGRDALLGCVVDNLKQFKVAWVRVDTQTILSIHHNIITQNIRISLSHNDHRSWYLHIKEVEESDRGWYMCQINTEPMRSRQGYLQVVVPPVIIESQTSNDMIVREGTNATLMCKASGYPEPYVMWRREDGDEIFMGGENVNVVDGELLILTKVSRLHMAAYLCVASNGVPPSISKRVHLHVQFPPMLSIPNQLVGAYIGQDVVLECNIEAYPQSINYWTSDKGDMIISDAFRIDHKYEISSVNAGYSKFMKLNINNITGRDYGSYRCLAKNSLGETDGLIKLDEIPPPTTIQTTVETHDEKLMVTMKKQRIPVAGDKKWIKSSDSRIIGGSYEQQQLHHHHHNNNEERQGGEYNNHGFKINTDADEDDTEYSSSTHLRNTPGAYTNSGTCIGIITVATTAVPMKFSSYLTIENIKYFQLYLALGVKLFYFKNVWGLFHHLILPCIFR